MSVTLTFGGDTLELSRLQAQPFGYEGNSRDGLTYRSWQVQGLVCSEDWLALLSIYESWRVLRFDDPDSVASDSIGTTVGFSGSAYGLVWSDVACWFDEAPAGSDAGDYWLSVSFLLVDAEQALEVAKRESEQNEEAAEDNRPDNGTWTVECPASSCSTTITLTKNPVGWAEGPEMERASPGNLVVSGPLGVIHRREIDGYTDEAGWDCIRCWYETITVEYPQSGQWYPAAPPQMDRELVTVSGVRTTRCNVSFDVWLVP